MDPYKIVKYPLTTEKSVRIMESENKLTLIVSLKASKSQIKKAVEDLFKVKVENITTMISPQGLKKAYVRLSPETPAIDVATQLGLM